MVDEISRTALRRALEASISASFATWSVMPSDVWAQEVRRRPGLYGATTGMSLDYFPPQRGMLAAIFDPRNQEVVLQIFSRGTKSETILTAIGYCMDQSPRRFIVMWPTTGQAEKWSKDDFQEQLVEPTPCLADILGGSQGKRQSGNTILFKQFPGGLMNIVGANSMGELRRAKGNFLYADEIDAIEESVSDEGDQLSILKKRGAEYPDTIEVYASYPSLKGQSRIAAKLEATDWNQWNTPCFKCGYDKWVMNRNRDLHYDADKPETAVLQCPNCGDFSDDDARYKRMKSGLWIPTREFHGKKGFQANALLWPHPVDKRKYPGGFLQVLAQQEIDCEKSDNPERARRVMVNTVDAEPYEPKFEEKVKHTDLYLRREEYDPRELLPEGVLWISLGGDVQDDRLECEIIGHGLDEQTWGLNYYVFPGSPLSPEPWEKLDKLIERAAWKHPLYGHMRIAAAAIDCGHDPDEVLKFTRPRRMRRVFAVFGSAQLGKQFVGSPTKRGNPPAMAYELGTNEAKDIIYQRLALTDPKAHGFCHFPKIGVYDEQYFKGLTIENATMKRGRDGDFYKAFECGKHDRNEPLDVRVYNLALPRICRINFSRLKERLDKAGKIIEPAQLAVPHSAPKSKPQPKIRRSSWMSGFR